jgi:hypothetical protein
VRRVQVSTRHAATADAGANGEDDQGEMMGLEQSEFSGGG